MRVKLQKKSFFLDTLRQTIILYLTPKTGLGIEIEKNAKFRQVFSKRANVIKHFTAVIYLSEKIFIIVAP